MGDAVVVTPINRAHNRFTCGGSEGAKYCGAS